MVTTAGLLMYSLNPLKVFLVCPGGPEFVIDDENLEINKNIWSIPKGHQELGEELFDCAIREFNEEVGFNPIIPHQHYDLGRVILKPGKELWVWAICGNTPDGWVLKSNEFLHNDGNMYPEVIEAKFFNVDEIENILEKSQIEFVRRLQNIIHTSLPKLNKVKSFSEMFKKSN